MGGGTKNLNTSQIGPEAVYCYRSGGTYTITLTARWWTGSAYASATTTQTVTVTQFSALAANTYYIDNINGNDSWTGKQPVPTPAGAPTDGPKATMQTGMVSIIAAIPTLTNVSINLAQGCVWNEAFGIKFLNFSATGGQISGIRIQPYVGLSGAGAQPQVNVTSGAEVALDVGNSGNNNGKSDVVVSRLYFSTTGTATNTAVVTGGNSVSTGTGQMNFIYFDQCTGYNALNIPGGMTCLINSGYNSTGWGVYGGSYTSPVFTTSGNKHSMFVEMTQWFFVVGATMSGSGSNDVLDHHIYPNCGLHSLYRWITFGPTGTGANQRSFCINTNWGGSDTAPAQCQFVHMVENSFGYTIRMHDLGNATNNAFQTQYLNVVCERNVVSGLTGGSLIPFACGQTYTNRDNQISNCEMGYLVPEATPAGVLQACVYRNTFSVGSGNGSGPIVQLSGGFHPMVFNTTSPTVVIDSTGAGAIGMPNQVPVRVFSDTGVYPSPLVAGTIYYASVNTEVGQSTTPTFPASGSTITVAGRTWSQNCPVTFSVTGGSLPTGVTAGSVYYWTPLTATTGTISATAGGTAITFTSAGTGTQTMTSPSGTGLILSATKGGAAIQPTTTGGGTLWLYPVWPDGLIMTDNSVTNAVSGGIAAAIDFSDQVAGSAYIDRNSWTFSASATPFQNAHINTTTNDNFATWQAAGFDLHGSFAI